MNVGSSSAPQPDIKATASPKEPPNVPPPKPTPKPDPVIQKLAARAAADPNLKELMKIVATSQANTAQLKEFQAHIDDLNALIKQEAEQERRKALASAVSIKAQEVESTKFIPSPASTSVFSASQPSTHVPPAYQSTMSKTLSSGGVAPHYAFYPPQPPPPPRVEPFIKHIVLELTSPASASQPASLDRWLFPEYAVLDSPHSGRGLEMICSFLVEKRGSEIDAFRNLRAGDPSQRSSNWKADTEYYQPVTMVLNAPQQRILQTIARAAKPLGEVQKYMEEILKTKTRATTQYLMLQLPRPGDDSDVQMTDFEDSAIELADDEEELKDYYGIG